MPVRISRQKLKEEPLTASGSGTTRPPKCKACDGSKKSSNGRTCYPCKGTGVQGAANKRIQG